MCMKYFLLSACLLFTLCVHAQSEKTPQSQNTKPSDTTKQIFVYVDQMPAPKYNLGKYLQGNLHYPDAARENNITGRVIVKFVVDKKGRIRDARIIKGIGGGCDEEALRVIENMPRWRPGRMKKAGSKRLKPVKVYFTQPITFNLE